MTIAPSRSVWGVLTLRARHRAPPGGRYCIYLYAFDVMCAMAVGWTKDEDSLRRAGHGRVLRSCCVLFSCVVCNENRDSSSCRQRVPGGRHAVAQAAEEKLVCSRKVPHLWEPVCLDNGIGSRTA